jgi:RNA-directed DNA polymerase
MRKTPLQVQDLQRKIYIKAKTDKPHKFWGLYTHITKMETLKQAYTLAKRNNGAPGIDGVTFGKIERSGVDEFLAELQKELKEESYKPLENRKQAIPKGNGKTRTLSIPSIRDRIVQGALKVILEPVFEADFQKGSYGYRPNRDAHKALASVKQAILLGKTKVIDLDIKAYFDSVRHDILFKQIAQRVQDKHIMRLIKLICKASGRRGIPQGGPLSPLLANIYLNDVDKMLEKAKETTRENGYINIGYSRFADDLVVLVDGHRRQEWLLKAVSRRLQEELQKLDLQINHEKTKIVDLTKDGSFSYLGFDVRIVKSLKGKTRPQITPKKEARSKLVAKVKDICKRYVSRPIQRVIELLNPIIRGWVNYFRKGNSGRCFKNMRRWIENKVRRHLAKARRRRGFGWKRWSNDLIYNKLKLYNDYEIRYYQGPKVQPA